MNEIWGVTNLCPLRYSGWSDNAVTGNMSFCQNCTHENLCIKEMVDVIMKHSTKSRTIVFIHIIKKQGLFIKLYKNIFYVILFILKMEYVNSETCWELKMLLFLLKETRLNKERQN